MAKDPRASGVRQIREERELGPAQSPPYVLLYLDSSFLSSIFSILVLTDFFLHPLYLNFGEMLHICFMNYFSYYPSGICGLYRLRLNFNSDTAFSVSLKSLSR